MVKLLSVTFSLSLGLLGFAPYLHAQDFWEGLQGCYKTLEWNGKNVTNQDEHNFSQISKGESQLALNTDYSPIKGYLFKIYQGWYDGKHKYDYAGTFSQLGAYSTQGEDHIFNFEDKVRYRQKPEWIVKLYHKVKVQKIDYDKIKVWSYTKIPDLPDGQGSYREYNADNYYVLKKVECAQDYPTISYPSY